MPLAAGLFTGTHGVECQSRVMGSRTVMGFTGLDFFASMAQFLSTLAMLGYIIITKRRAVQGSAQYASRLVLPAYIKILYMFAFASFLAGLAHLVESAVGQSCSGETAAGVPAEKCCAVEIIQMDAAGPGSENEKKCIREVYMNFTTSMMETCTYLPGGGPINNFMAGLGWKVKSFLVALDWAVFHVVLEGLALFLMQKGAGARAYWRAVTRALVWGAFTFFLVFRQEWLRSSPVTGTRCAVDLYGTSSNTDDDDINLDMVDETGIDTVAQQVQLDAFKASITRRQQSNNLVLLWHVLLLAFYCALRFAPQQRLSRRPAAIFYASFMMLLRAIYVVALLLERTGGGSQSAQNARGVGFCLYTAGHLILFSIVEPIWVFMTLQRDSEYWRGHTGGGKVDASKRTGRGSGGNLNAALVGRVSLNESAASALAETMDQFGRDHSYVELLNFAFLTIHTKKVVGAGGTAKVYEGEFKGETVAIKLVYPPELTHEEVTGFLREASALEEAGEHENIIKVMGVCVMPPSIALVLEMCEQGDLNSHIRQQSQQGTLDRRQQLELAVDCARGVDFLHNGNDDNPRLNGPIIHNDLKSFNVLVRVNDRTEKPFVAKIADLEFAQDDGLSVAKGRGDGGAQFVRTQSALMRPPPVPDTVNWTAPELMRVGEEGWPTVDSDAWALGMLLFEIFALELPFAEGQCTVDLKQTLQRQQEAAANLGADAALEATVAPPFYGREYLISRICDGDNPLRPPLCDDPTGRASLVPPDVSTLLRACWADNPAQRLSPRSMKEGLYALVRSAPKRVSDLESLHGVGLPQVPALRPQYRSKPEGNGGAAALQILLSDPRTPEDDESSDGNDERLGSDLVRHSSEASQESRDSVTLTDFEARGTFGVGTLGSGGRNRPRQISERGVGLPTPRALGVPGSGAPLQDPTGFGSTR